MAKMKISFEEFSARVIKAYNGRISVVENTYTGTRNKVTAYCNVHKIYFEVRRAYDLSVGKINCPECSKEQKAEAKIVPFSEMLKRFRNAFGNKFSYDESSYRGRKVLMKVHCNDCGEDFEITPEHHLKYNNGGCPECSKYLTVKCAKCGKQILVNKHIDSKKSIYCDECKKIKKHKNICKICGIQLNDDLKCKNDFCNKHNYQQIRTLIKYFNFDENKLSTVEVEKEFNRIRDILYDMYWNQHMSSTEICKVFNYPSSANLTAKVFKYLDIPSKNVQQSVFENILMGRFEIITSNSNYKDGYHITWDNKKVYLRSSYEFDYAQILDENHILYEVEAFRICYFDTQEKRKRIAIPDFYLPEINTIVEIKSTWTLDVNNMIDRVKAYKENGYKFKLILEHKEVDIYSLINEPKFKSKRRECFSLKRKTRTTINQEKWHWMNDGINNYKVLESQIDEYKSKGFVFGCLMNVRNNSNQDNLIIESLTHRPDSSDTPSSNPLF